MEFNFSDSFNRYSAAHYSTYEKPVPFDIKKTFKKFREVFIQEDEHMIFEIFSRCRSLVFDGKFTCPKCGKETDFHSDRYKRWDKVVKKQRPVLMEKKRTMSCQNCSFVFSPLAISPMRNTKIDLRCYLFYMIISRDGQIKVPVNIVVDSLCVTRKTALRIIDIAENGNEFKQDEQQKILARGENHWQINLMLQKFNQLKAS